MATLNGTTSGSASMILNLTVGNLVVIGVSGYYNYSRTITDGLGNTYTLRVTTTQAAIYSGIVATGGAATFTMTTVSAEFGGFIAAEYSGASSATPYATNTASASNVVSASPSMSIPSAGSLIVAMFHSTGQNVAAVASCEIRGEIFGGGYGAGAMLDVITDDGAARTVSGSVVSTSYDVAAASFSPVSAGGGGGSTPRPPRELAA